MTLAVHRVFYTFGDYVDLEAGSPVKHEYLDGQIYAMAGGTPEHAALAAAVTAKLGAALAGGRCRVFSSDLRVRIAKTGLATYPDVTVVCGPRAVDPEDRTSVTNPILLVEVTSKRTEDYDRGEKFDHYAQLPSLAEYVLVSHRAQEIEVRRRAADGTWKVEVARAGDRVALASLGASLDVDAIYAAATDPVE